VQLSQRPVGEAIKKPGGWVHEIVGHYGQRSPDDPVLPSAARGAGKIGRVGEIAGDFVA